MEVSEVYKRTEIGVIPLEWDVKRLEEMTVLMTNGFVGAAKRHYVENDIGILYIQGFNVEENSFNFQGIKRVSVDFHRKNKKSCLHEDDLLTVQTGDVGLTTVVPKELEGVNCHALIISRFQKEKYLPKFYSFYFNSYIGRTRLKEIETGTTMKHINVGTLKYFLVPIPTYPEQQAIAEALSDVDDLISSLTKLINKKKNIKQGTTQELLTVKKRLEGYSGEWVKKTLGDLFDFYGGYSASRSQLSAEGYCYLHYGDIHGSNKQFIDVENEYMGIPKLDIPLSKITKEKMLQDGDIVFVDASEDDEGTSRHIVVCNPNGVPFISGLHTIVAKGKDGVLNKKFRQYCFQSDDIKKQFKFYAAGTKVSGISRSNIAKIELSFPISIEEQIAIANILSDMDAEIEALEQKLNKYKAIKQGMMQELLTGKIRLI